MKFLFAIALLMAGIVSIVSPETAWHLKEGWKFEDVTPSEDALEVTRMIGFVQIFAAIAILLWF